MNSLHQTLVRGLLACAILFAPEALALMPPHVSHTVPAPGEPLQGDTIVFHGYSLEYADDADVSVIDLATERPVAFSTVLDCAWEGHDPPGHVGGTQLRCELKVTLTGLEPGHRYRATYMDTALEFHWDGPAPAAPPAQEKQAPPADPGTVPAPSGDEAAG
jgi:hypothetical protein